MTFYNYHIVYGFILLFAGVFTFFLTYFLTEILRNVGTLPNIEDCSFRDNSEVKE
jgi:hypothetical protein